MRGGNGHGWDFPGAQHLKVLVASPARVMLGCAHASGSGVSSCRYQNVEHCYNVTVAQQSPVLFNVTATDLNVN